MKDSIDKFNRRRSNAGEEMMEEKMLESLLKVVDRAWKQTIKYGMMCFLVSPHAFDDAEQGRVVRHILKDVRGRHRKCDEIKDCLGDYLVTRIENMLEMIQPKKAATASQAATAQGPVVKRQRS